MTNFEYMKKKVLDVVAALDEAELRQLVSDTCMDEGGGRGIFSCGLCEEVYGDCDTVPGGNGCMKKYSDWCAKERIPETGLAEAWEDKEDIVRRLSILLKATRIGSGIDRLVLSSDKRMVTVKYANGAEKRVNVEGDSGYAIIKDVMKAL